MRITKDYGSCPGSSRRQYYGRNWEERGFTIGIGGPVGSGKTALTLALCRRLRNEFNIAVTTNDTFSHENAQFLIKNRALPRGRIRTVETGGYPHTAICEDISANVGALESLQADYDCQMLFVESGGVNSEANYSRELADYIIYVMDVPGAEKIFQRGGAGVSQSDLLVINKIDLAPYLDVSLSLMDCESKKLRGNSPTLFTNMKQGSGVEDVARLILRSWTAAGSPGKAGPVGDEV